MTAGAGKRHCFHQRVVHRRAARRGNAAERPANRLPLRGPAFEQHWAITEPVEKHFVVRTEQVVEEAIECRPCGVDLFARHTAARVERETEADRHSVGAELRHRLPRIHGRL